MNFHQCICVYTWSSFYIALSNVTEFGPSSVPYMYLRFTLKSNFLSLFLSRISSVFKVSSIIEAVCSSDGSLSSYLSLSFDLLVLDLFLVKKDQHPLVLFYLFQATSFDIIKSCLLFRLNLIVTFGMASAVKQSQ